MGRFSRRCEWWGLSQAPEKTQMLLEAGSLGWGGLELDLHGLCCWFSFRFQGLPGEGKHLLPP